jgi:hypothetical protein
MEVPADPVVEQFEPDTPSVSRALRFLRQAIQALLSDEAGGDLADALIMAADELATNA